MRIAAQTDENEQLDICTSFTGKLLDCRHRLSSVPCIEQPETKICEQPSKSRPSPL